MQAPKNIKCKKKIFFMKIVYYDSDIVDSTYLYVLAVKMPFIPYL